MDSKYRVWFKQINDIALKEKGKYFINLLTFFPCRKEIQMPGSHEIDHFKGKKFTKIEIDISEHRRVINSVRESIENLENDNANSINVFSFYFFFISYP